MWIPGISRKRQKDILKDVKDLSKKTFYGTFIGKETYTVSHRDEVYETKKTMNKTDYEAVFGINDEYYKYIFKKTEKIVCAVFYITRNETSFTHNDQLVKDLEAVAQAGMSETLASLTARAGTLHQHCTRIAAHLVALEAHLRMVHAAGMLTTELLHVFVNNLDSVGRTLRKYMRVHAHNPLLTDLDVSTESVMRTGRASTPSPVRRNGPPAVAGAEMTPVVPKTHNRTTRIMEVLKEKGQASIKDVSDVITDCSEKTIQRELNALIKDGTVVREGERRWSRYSVV